MEIELQSYLDYFCTSQAEKYNKQTIHGFDGVVITPNIGRKYEISLQNAGFVPLHCGKYQFRLFKRLYNAVNAMNLVFCAMI